MVETKNNNLFDEEIRQAVETLRSGELVSFPTETVYGLGADATNKTAIAKVFEAKNRPVNHPLIVHINHVSKLSDWAINIPSEAYLLAKHFWPGPLTMILDKQHWVPGCITGGQATVGLRIPRHPMTLSLLKHFKGLVGPSANRFGHISPTQSTHVRRSLNKSDLFVLEGGPCQIGIESTIIRLASHQAPCVLRQGMITPYQIAQVLGKSVDTLTCNRSQITKVPGQHLSHYAPDKPVVLLQTKPLLHHVKSSEKPLAILSFSPPPAWLSSQHIWLTAPLSPQQYGTALYQCLHRLERSAAETIVIESVPKTPEWVAIADRLQRAGFEYTIESEQAHL